MTINRNTEKLEPEIETDGSSQIRQNLRVHEYGSGFGPPRCSGSRFWTGLELNRTRAAGGLSGPIAKTTLSLFFILSTHFSTLARVCFVRMVGYDNVILSSVHGRLTTSKTFTCIQSNSPIALCAKHRNRRLEKGIHRRGN